MNVHKSFDIRQSEYQKYLIKCATILRLQIISITITFSSSYIMLCELHIKHYQLFGEIMRRKNEQYK